MEVDLGDSITRQFNKGKQEVKAIKLMTLIGAYNDYQTIQPENFQSEIIIVKVFQACLPL